MKAKDLLKKAKNTPEKEDINEEVAAPPDKEGAEEDDVTAAYESINKRLEALKKGQVPKEEDEDENEPTKEDDEELEAKNSKKDGQDADPLDNEDVLPEDDEEEEKDFEEQLEEEGQADKPPVQEAGQPPVEPAKTFQPNQAEGTEDTFENVKLTNVNIKNNPEDVRTDPGIKEHDLDDLANEPEDEDLASGPGQNFQRPANPPFSNQPPMPQQPGGYPQEEDDEGVHIPALGAGGDKPKYSFYQQQPQIGQQPSSRGYGGGQTPAGYGSGYRRINNPAFGSTTRDYNGSAKWQWLILLVIGLGVVAGTVFFLKNQFQLPFNLFGSKTASQPTPQPTFVAIATPEPTPTPIPVDRTIFKVRVLNGTSKTGFAATVSAKLKELGYQTDKAANATNSAFLQTVVRVKPSKKTVEGTTKTLDQALLEQLIRDLSDQQFNATSSTSLKETDGADAEVILGES